MESSKSTGRLLNYFRWITGAFILLTILMFWNLGNADRSFPTAPLFGFHSFLAGNVGLLFNILLAAAAVLFAVKAKPATWLLVVLMLLAFADDLNRLTPATFQYFAIVAVCAFFPKADDDSLLNSFRIIQAGVYIWSGVLKLNFHFIEQSGNFLFKTIHATPTHWFYYFLFAIPVAEIAIGFCFLFKRQLQAAVLLTLVLHGFIILQLVVSQWNESMILYNLFLVVANFILFFQLPINYQLFPPKVLAQKICILFFLFLPALNLVRWWPDCMSSVLYTGQSWLAVVYIDKAFEKQLPQPAQKAIFNSPQGRYLSFTYWLENETGYVPNPEKFVYHKMFTQLKLRYAASDSVRLYLYK
jgi:hypothetical protein